MEFYSILKSENGEGDDTVIKRFFRLFATSADDIKIPDGYEKCFICFGTGTDDGICECPVCDGFGFIDKIKIPEKKKELGIK